MIHPLKAIYHRMLKRRLLRNISCTYCRIANAEERGVGVFAIRDIPAGIDPFEGPKKRRWLKVNLQEIEHLGPAVLKMVDDFCIIRENQDVYVYEEGLNGLHIRWFLNHSKTPNVETTDTALTFRTLREIKAGEELFYDYGSCCPDWQDASLKRVSREWR